MNDFDKEDEEMRLLSLSILLHTNLRNENELAYSH